MSEDSKSFKVVDKRRLDSEGKEREGAEQASSATASTSEPVGEQGAPIIDFSSFAMSLATQVLMQLGELDAPPGMDVPKNVPAAKQTIEILEMLQLKTAGNLDAGEENLMKEIMHNLHLSFVKASQA
jgi:hypothetical protein